MGQTCVTEQELKALLEKNQIDLISNSSNSPNQAPSTNDQNIETTPEPTPEPSPTPTPEPEPTPTPTE